MMSVAAWGQNNVATTGNVVSYEVNPQSVRQHFDGWGVSLCWWAGQCGKWTDDKIDEIVAWLVSPEGLNYSHFRYNIGGGDDPLNRHCTPHHMGQGTRCVDGHTHAAVVYDGFEQSEKVCVVRHFKRVGRFR